METNQSNYVIETEGISRSFGKSTALQDFSLKIPRGSVYGFLGRNGAGKTTAIKILAGLIKSDTGSVRVLGKDPFYFTPEDRQRVGYLSEKQILPAQMKVRNIVSFCAPLYPLWDHDLVRRLFERFQIDTGKRISALSQGAQRQVAFILCLAQKPDLLILDEPASTLDVVARREFLDEILNLVREGGPTVFLSSHILSDIERVADHIGILAQGTLKISEPLDDLKESIRKICFYSTNGSLANLTLPGTLHVESSGKEMVVTARITDEALIAETARKFEATYEIQPLNLEDIFVEISRR